ncbi:30S ribosomal protein S4 [Candidatus Woesearchaeota archaeon]|nr:30S ribosomal protein S4 [Candidatus Woesearchaeota archaeon]
MGDIKKLRKKYSKPSHPWQKKRIEDEAIILREFGLKNKRELWKSSSILKQFTAQAKNLIAARSEQSEKEKKQLLDKLQSLGVLKGKIELDTVLGLSVKDVLNRRLQTLVVKNGLVRSTKQARQLITHQHVQVKDKTVSSPSYLVRIDEEQHIKFDPRSALSNPDHPERSVKTKGAKT